MGLAGSPPQDGPRASGPAASPEAQRFERPVAPPFHWTNLTGLGRGRDLVDLLQVKQPRRDPPTDPLDAAQQTVGRDQVETLLGPIIRTKHSHIQFLTRERTRAEDNRRPQRVRLSHRLS